MSPPGPSDGGLRGEDADQWSRRTTPPSPRRHATPPPSPRRHALSPEASELHRLLRQDMQECLSMVGAEASELQRLLRQEMQDCLRSVVRQDVQECLRGIVGTEMLTLQECLQDLRWQLAEWLSHARAPQPAPPSLLEPLGGHAAPEEPGICKPGPRQEVRDGLDRSEEQEGGQQKGGPQQEQEADRNRRGTSDGSGACHAAVGRQRSDATAHSTDTRQSADSSSSGRKWRMKSRVSGNSPGGLAGSTEPEISGPMSGVRAASWRLIHVHGTAFDSVIGLVILLSSVFVGVEIQCDLEGDTKCVNTCVILDHVFQVIYIVELSIRVLADGMESWHCGWFRFDFALVLIGVLSDWVIEPVLRQSDGDDKQLFFDVQSKVLMLRILRLVRLVRALRLVEQFRETWKLANGLMRSFHTVWSACMMIVLTVFLFACLGIELVLGNDTFMEDPATAMVVKDNFATLPMTMLTLIAFANADSIASVYKPIVDKAWYMAIYFGIVWLVVTITLMNLITAVIVDTAIAQADEDREMELQSRRRKLRDLEPCIRNVFRALLDQAGTEKLSRSAFRSGLKDMQAIGMKDLPSDLREVLETGQIVEVCDFLDADRSGEIDESEFMDGIFNLLLESVPIETTQMLQMLRTQNEMLKHLTSVVDHRRPSKKHQKTGITNGGGDNASD